jgi:hypothetical protein
MGNMPLSRYEKNGFYDNGGMMNISGESNGDWVAESGGAGMYGGGGEVEINKDGLYWFVLTQMSSGFIANNSNANDYATADKIRKRMIHILQKGGDRPYSLKNAVDLVKEAENTPSASEQYADGGSLDLLATTAGTPTTNTGGTTFSNADLSGIFAKGGLLQHGLRIGDVVQRYSGNSIVVFNKFTNEYFDVDLNKGERIIRREYGGSTEIHRTED